MIYRIKLLSIIIFIFLSTTAYCEDSLILGIHPYLPSTELIDRFTPLADYLSKKTGKRVIIEISKDYKDHIDKVGKNKYDIAFMGPVSYVKMLQKYSKKPLICRLEVNGKPTFRGAIVTSKEGKIKSLGDLKDKRFTFVEPESTMGYIVPLYLLLNAGIKLKDLSEYKFLYNHNNVALSVLAGDFDAGAVKEDVFYQYEKRGLNVLSWTPPISEHLFVVRNGLSKEMINTLREVFISLKYDKDALGILKRIQENLTGFVTVSEKDYENLKNIYQSLQKVGYRL